LFRTHWARGLKQTQVLAKAITEALKSPVRTKVGAVLATKRGRIVTAAHNKILYGDGPPFTLHAEHALLLKAAKLRAFSRFKDLQVWVVRVKANGLLGLAKPCKQCRKLLADKVSAVFYSTETGFERLVEE